MVRVGNIPGINRLKVVTEMEFCLKKASTEFLLKQSFTARSGENEDLSEKHVEITLLRQG